MQLPCNRISDPRKISLKFKVSRFIIVIPILHGAQPDVPPCRLWNSKIELGLSSRRRNRTITINYSKIAEHSVHTYSGNEDNSLDTHWSLNHQNAIGLHISTRWSIGKNHMQNTGKSLTSLVTVKQISHGIRSPLQPSYTWNKKSTKHRINQKCSKHKPAFILNESGPHSVVYYVPVDLLHKC